METESKYDIPGSVRPTGGILDGAFSATWQASRVSVLFRASADRVTLGLSKNLTQASFDSVQSRPMK
ncbi:hypothetical protein YC2023_060852 [Brassica napus]